MALDVYTMDRLEGIRQEELEKNILMVIRGFRNIGSTAEEILRGIMESFHLSHDEATAYLQKA